ncbi:MAG: membrane protein insertase YidC [Candidatus Dependentiae bacterium]|nr:membrane protein insertase YidC [Candidatus Dependentiae bacterium]
MNFFERMNFKDLVVPLSLALLTTWGLHYFFFSKNSEETGIRAGQSFVAPKNKQELKPLNTEVDFIDVQRPGFATRTEVETHGARLIFSTDGASLESLEFKHLAGCPACPLSTIEAPAEVDKAARCFLVALDHETPYYYTLVSRQDVGDTTELLYQADFPKGSIQKKYTVHKDTYKIDLEIKLEPQNPETSKLEPRIFFSSPFVAPIEQTDVVSAIVSNEKGSLDKVGRDRLTVGQGWFSPRLFGTDDRYFVNALVEDAQGFVQRAYYKFADKTKLTSILEGPAVGLKTETCCNQWKLSFYFGPKESAAFAKVDNRLEQTLDYAGFFAPISKFLLAVLRMLYSYLKNYGFAIIAMTFLVKLVLLPFSYGAEDSMQKRADFDKKLRHIQQKYKNEPDMLAQERAALIQKHGMPGLSGCLPLLLQVPIFIALSRVLSSAIELYQAPFIGWIHDLSVRDPYFVLPIVTALGMIFQTAQKPGNDPKQQLSTVVMALVIGAVTANLAAGLALYICMFTWLGIAQTKLLAKFKRS